jgi:DNA polymerase I
MTQAFDSETYLIEPGRVAPKLVSVGFLDVENDDIEDRHAVTMLGPQDKPEICDRLFERGEIVAGANTPFDLGVIAEEFPDTLPEVFKLYREDKTWDVQTVDKMAHIAAGWSKFRADGEAMRVKGAYSLASVTRRNLGIKMEGKKGDDIWRLKYDQLADIPFEDWPEEAKKYAQLDVCYTGQIAAGQMPHKDKLPTMDLQHKAHWALHLMTAWGVRTDPTKVALLEDKLLTKKALADAQLKKHGLRRLDGSKNMAVIHKHVIAAYEKLGKKYPKTKTGKPQASEEALRGSEDPLLLELADIAATDTIISKFLSVIKQGVSLPINAMANILVDTGRTSFARPNTQQLPKIGGVRECFIPRPGYVFVAADYSIAELCSLSQVLLHLFGESKMANAIRDGKDLHIHTAASILGIDYKTAMARYLAGDKKVADARDLSKAANFGYMGGMGAPGFVYYAKGYGVNIDFAQSARIREIWLAEYPEMLLYFDWINAQAMGHTYTSQHPITGFVRGGVGFTDGANHNAQHLTSCGAKEALFNVAEECYLPGTELFGSRPVFFVHDEIIMETPIPRAHEAAMRLKTVMEDSMTVYVKDIPCKVEATMMNYWSKKAKPTYDGGGRLIPWVDNRIVAP